MYRLRASSQCQWALKMPCQLYSEMHRSELDLTAHAPLDGADERDAERYKTTRLVRFVRKNQIYATYVWTAPDPSAGGVATASRIGLFGVKRGLRRIHPNAKLY